MLKKMLIASVTLCFLACGPSTKIVNSWRDPDVVVNTSSLNKFVVAALLKNEAVRRRVEDNMANRYPGKAVPSYQVFGPSELTGSEDSYTQKLKSGGYDGIVILRLVKVDNDQRYVPGSYPAYYGRWWGYWRYSWPMYYDPGYYTTDKTYYVEVNVYSVTRDKLIWSGTTSTINPAKGQLFDDVINTVDKKMHEEGFIK